MKPYLGPAAKPQYQSALYRANMQGADHGAFIGYLLIELQELTERVLQAEAKLARLTGGESLSAVATPVVALPVVLPDDLPPPVQAPAPVAPKPAKPVEAVRESDSIDADALAHIVIEIDDQPTKKRGK